MAFDLASAQPTVDSSPKKGFDISSSTPVGEKPKKDESDKREQYSFSDILKEGGVGAVAGALAPEILTYGVAPALAMTPAAPLAPFVAGAGEIMQGSRLASAVSGGIGGLVGETGGQAVEKKYGPGVTAETARLLGSSLGAEPFAYLGTKGGRAVGSLMKFIPGMSTAKTVGQLLQEADVAPRSLSADQRAFIEKKLGDIRGGQPSIEAQKEIFNMLQEGANKIQQQAESQAFSLEQQSKQILDEVANAKGRISVDLDKRINALQSQFETAAQNLRQQSENQSQKIIADAEAKAQRIRANAETQAPAVRQIAETDAKAAIQDGRTQADNLLKQTNDRLNRLKQARDSLRQTGSKRLEAAQGQFKAVGEPILPTDLGARIRSSFVKTLDNLKTQRDKVIENIKTPVFTAASAKEAQGARYQNTQAFRDSIAAIDKEIASPETGLSNIPSNEIRSTIEKVKQQLQEGIVRGSGEEKQVQPLSFQALDILRRNLRDRAFGLPAEGYDAIGQQQASRLAEYVENIMDEFSPGFKAYKDAYKEASKPINELRTKFGKSVTDKPEGFDLGQFVKDPATLGSEAFKYRSTVEQLVNVVGRDEAEQLAKGFVADKLRNATGKDVQKFVNETARDWIDTFPALKSRLMSASKELQTAENVSGKRAKLSDILGTEIKTLPIKAQQSMSRAEQDATRIAEAKISAGEREAGRIATTAERESGKVAGEGATAAEQAKKATEQQITQSSKSIEKQKGRLETTAEQAGKEAEAKAKELATPLTQEAQKIRNEAKKRVDIILGSKTAPERIRDFILGADREEWSEIGNIIRATPGGRDKLAEAIGQVVADKANKSLKGAIDDMKYLGDRLVSNGLMDQAGVDALQSKLQEIFVSPVDVATKTTLAQRAVKNAIVSYAIPRISKLGGL